MRRRLIFALAAVAVAAAACGPGSASVTTVAPSAVPEGSTAAPRTEPAPGFTVSTFDGGTFSLAEHLAADGRPVFLNLWASWCLPCREEMPAIDAAARRHPGVRFVGIAVQDSPSDAAAFAAEIGVGYPLGFDDQGAVDEGYRPLGLPASYLISGDGFLLEEFYGQLTGELIDQKIAAWFGG